MKIFPIFIFTVLFTAFGFSQENAALPENFVRVRKVIPDIKLEMRYAGNHNFTGRPVKGYLKEVAILTKPAANALCLVQEYLKTKGYKLKIFDAYRPQQAVNNFIEWSHKADDTLMKTELYPDLQKKNLRNYKTNISQLSQIKIKALKC